MACMFAALSLALAAQQEAQVLSWKLDEGRKLAVTWRQRVKVDVKFDGRPALAMELDSGLWGRLRVSSKLRDGRSECLLTLMRQEIKGRFMDRAVELVVENGQVRRNEGLGNDLDWGSVLSEPVWIKIAATGAYETEKRGAVSKYFSNMEDMFGPRLPGEVLKAGAVWTVNLRPYGMDGLGGKVPGLHLASIAARYTVTGVETVDGSTRARLRVEETREADDKDVHVKMTLGGEAVFDVGAGHCMSSAVRWKVAAGGTDQGRALDAIIESSAEFSSEPAR